MTITFYDMSAEAWREAVQEDWDLRQHRLAEQHHEIERLRARIAELEAQLAMAAGTMAFPSREEREAFRIEHDTPPTTPR